MMKINRNRVTNQMSLMESFSFEAIRIEIMECLIPTSNQQKRLFILSSYWAPFHTPNRSIQNNLILYMVTVTFSSRLRCLKETVPLTVPKANVCPSALQPEEIIFYLNFYLGISFLPGMNRAKSDAPPLKSSWVRGLKLKVKMALFCVSFRTGSSFFSAQMLNLQITQVLSFLYYHGKDTKLWQKFSHPQKMPHSLWLLWQLWQVQLQLPHYQHYRQPKFRI